MATTTNVVQRSRWWVRIRDQGYFFRQAAVLTIALGFALHLYRVIFGDAATLQHVLTPTTDVLLLIPMTYAAVTGIIGRPRMTFVNRAHRAVVTASIAYIALSVPLHLYVLLVLGDVSFYVHIAGAWFSYLLLCVVYPAFLVMLSRVRYKS